MGQLHGSAPGVENYGEVGGALSLLQNFGGARYDTLRLEFLCLSGKAYGGSHFSLDFWF